MRQPVSASRFAAYFGIVTIPFLVPLGCGLDSGGSVVFGNATSSSSSGGGSESTGVTSPSGVGGGSAGGGGIGGGSAGGGGIGGGSAGGGGIGGGSGGAGGIGGGSAGGGGIGGGSGGAGGAGGGPVMPGCGNGVVEAGEECDDGNAVNGDTCTACMACNGPQDFWDTSTYHCYTYVKDQSKNWADARTACSAMGGDLAAISSKKEQAFLDSKNMGDAWVGGTDSVTECVFVWSNGEPFAPFWGSGEPNNSGNEDCVQLRPDALYNDAKCSSSINYLCERVPMGGCGDGIVQAGEHCDDGNANTGDGCDQCKLECGPGEVLDPASLHCYLLVTNADKQYDAARNDCVAKGGKLAAITSPAESAFVTPLIGANTWIGGRDNSIAGTVWDWETGEPFCWTNWKPNEPSLFEDCIEIQPGGGWNNQGCNSTRDYLCERAPLGN